MTKTHFATMLARTLSTRTSFRAFSSRVLVVADHDNSKLFDSTMAALTAAQQIGGSVTMLVAGSNCATAAKQAAGLKGVAKVMCADNAAYAHGGAENLAALVHKHAAEFTHVVTSASSTGKGFIPRAAVLNDSAPITDVIAVKSADTFVRPIYAGNALSTVQSTDKIKFITVRPTNFDKAGKGTVDVAVEAAALPEKADLGLTVWKKDELKKSDRPELASARVVISGGRGMKSGDNFTMLYELADLVKGAVGASRAAVDAGFVSNDLQIGQTGKVVAPDLYVAVGISGAIQHLAGMKDSKVIVAINKDAEAPIFQVSDFGIVGDLFKVVPELSAEVKKTL